MKYLRSARIGVAAAAVVATTFGLGGLASAQDYTSTSQTNISGPVSPGGTIQVSGTSAAGCVVEVMIDGVVVNSSTLAAGSYSIPFTVPSNLGAGDHDLVIEICGAVTSSTQFKVAAANSGGQAELADTGVESGPLALTGLSLVAAGGFLLVLRKRETANVTS